MSDGSILSSINPAIPIILASGSQSRKIMLEDAGIIFKTITSEVDEDSLKIKIASMPFKQQVIELAKAKAEVVSSSNLGNIVIGGDQMCIFENKVFDKPGSKEKAISNLKLLSGTKTEFVIWKSGFFPKVKKARKLTCETIQLLTMILLSVDVAPAI